MSKRLLLPILPKWIILFFYCLKVAISVDRSTQSNSYSTISGFSCYRDLQGMTNAMLDLEADYPDLVTIADIGDSYLKESGNENGHDIYVMKITASTLPNPAKVLLTGGMHAREYAPPELLMRFATQLVQNYNEDADTTWILDTTEIHIVLYVNPDGRSIAETLRIAYWRKNVNPGTDFCLGFFIGTDINRNFDWMWGDTSGASEDPCDFDYHGTSPLSEPETRAITEYAKALFPEDQRKSDPVADMNVPYGENITGVYMDIHAFGGLTYYPWNYINELSPDNDSLEAFARKVSSYNGYELWSGTQPYFLYAATGVASDYMYAHLGVASVGLEIGDAFYQECDAFESTIVPDNLPALMYVIKVAERPNSLVKGPDLSNLSVKLDASNETLQVFVEASDSKLVNIPNYPTFATGDQSVVKTEFFLDTLPNDYGEDDIKYVLQMNSDTDNASFELNISTVGLEPGRHALFVQATDSDGYAGPVSSVFFDVQKVESSSQTTTSTAEPSKSPSSEETDAVLTAASSDSPSSKPISTNTVQPSEDLNIMENSMSMSPTVTPTRNPSFSSSNDTLLPTQSKMPSTGTISLSPVPPQEVSASVVPESAANSIMQYSVIKFFLIGLNLCLIFRSY